MSTQPLLRVATREEILPRRQGDVVLLVVWPNPDYNAIF